MNKHTIYKIVTIFLNKLNINTFTEKKLIHENLTVGVFFMIWPWNYIDLDIDVASYVCLHEAQYELDIYHVLKYTSASNTSTICNMTFAAIAILQTPSTHCTGMKLSHFQNKYTLYLKKVF